MIDYYMGTHLFTGADCINNNAGAFSEFGKRCLIITGKSGVGPNGPLKAVERLLNEQGICFSISVGSYQNPTVSQAQELGTSAAAMFADYLIGIGGGSVLDLTKSASVFAANPGIDESGFYSGIWEHRPIPTILIGTTSGTGSEVTSVAVLIDSTGRKHSIHHKLLYGRYAFGDPTYTMSVPESVTVSTCIDALSHCVESYFTKKANLFSKPFSIAGTKLFLKKVSGLQSLSLPISYSTREALYEISILGGMAINITGTTFPHSMGYYFTERYHLPHGFASALFLPELLHFAEKNSPQVYCEFFNEIGCSPDRFMEVISTLLPTFDIHLTEDEIDAELPRWENNSVKNCCSQITLPEIKQMLKRKFG